MFAVVVTTVVMAMAPGAKPSAPVTRDYAGQTEVEPAPDTKDIETAKPVVAETDVKPETILASEATEEAVVAPAPQEQGSQSIARKRRPVPRLLSTIYGYQQDERAVIGKGRVKFYPGIQVRNQIGYISPFTIDRFGTQYNEGAFSNGRVRWRPELQFGKKFKIVGTLDVASGRWAPSTTEDPVIDDIIENGHPPDRTTLRIADPRELYIEAKTALGLLRIGQQSFTWGQGILANNGNYADRFGDLRFGDDGPGDIYERILFITKPFKYRNGPIRDLALGFGADIVFRDDRLNLIEGDLAGQGFVVIRWQPSDKPGTWLGGYVVYRNQKTVDDGDVYADDDDLEVGAFDIAGQHTWWLRDDLQVAGAFEGVLIAGRTTVARNEDGTHRVLQGGAAGRLFIGDHLHWLLGADMGYASGDPDPDDKQINNFTFDPGHNVGLVLFKQVQGWRTAQSEILASNGDLTGVAPNGTQFIPTRGGLSNAVYLHPKVRYSLKERVEIWGGPLFAAAPVPIVDPYATRINGGTPANTLLGDGANRFYGTELDIGIRGRFDIKNFWLQAGLQGGILMPGAGLANEVRKTDGTVAAVWFRTELRY